MKSQPKPPLDESKPSGYKRTETSSKGLNDVNLCMSVQNGPVFYSLTNDFT